MDTIDAGRLGGMTLGELRRSPCGDDLPLVVAGHGRLAFVTHGATEAGHKVCVLYVEDADGVEAEISPTPGQVPPVSADVRGAETDAGPLFADVCDAGEPAEPRGRAGATHPNEDGGDCAVACARGE